MTAREYLRQCKEAETTVRRLRAEYEKEREMIDAVRSTADLDGMPHGNGLRKPLEDYVIRLADKAMEFKMAQLDALHIRQEIFETINKVGGDEANVLVERYLNGLTWKEVEHAVGWSRPKVWELHRNGIEKIEALIN